MKGKNDIIKGMKNIPLSMLLVSSMVLSNGQFIIQAIDNNQVVLTSEVSSLTDSQLANLTNPVLQSYKADSTHKIWKMTSDSKLVIMASASNVTNNRLAEVVKLINGEFTAKAIVSNSPLAMVYAPTANASDILINIAPVSTITDKSTSSEAYKIDIDENGVSLTGASENAVLYGLRTIQNLVISNSGLVYGTIVDYPDVAERRVHVDCARKYISKDWFIREIREMSYMKMNAIQIHFSENLGFRIECETDPAIVSEQHLTKNEVREIIAEANKYGIKVIPSFDSPGHVDQILKVHPEYGQVSNTGSHYASGLDITNPVAIEYIRSLYSEYMDLFEGCTDFHIGGDEYMEFDRPPFTTQYQSVLDAYAKNNLGSDYTWKDTVANYINELAKFVHDRGFTPRIWNDGIYYGENSANPQKIVMHDYIGIDFWSQMSWNYSIARLQTFIDHGHDTIYNINASFFYYVLRNDVPTDGREQHSFDVLDQDKNIFNNWMPGKFQGNTVLDDSSFIKGASLAIWCDNANACDEDTITEDISDELRCLATKSWNTSSNANQTFEQFKENYTKLGHVAGYDKKSVLPEVGEILQAENLGKVTLKYVSTKGKVLKNDVVKYGDLNSDYHFSADDIYGYKITATDVYDGKYGKDDVIYTFVYELDCHKDDLQAQVNSPLTEVDYIKETLNDYKTALALAKNVLSNEDSEQVEVDQALANLLAGKNKAVTLLSYPLYIETTYPLKDTGYISGYTEYQNAINAGKNVLYGDNLTVDTINESLKDISDAKKNLMKPDGNVPTVSATDNYYTDWSVWPSDKYSYDKMLDSDASTKCWFGQEQVAGKEVVFTFGKEVNMSSVQVIQPSNVGADALAGASIQISNDKENWQTVGTISGNELDKKVNFEATPTRYVRILLTTSKAGYWYQIQDVKFVFEQIQESSTLKDLINTGMNVDCKDKSSVSVSTLVDALIAGQVAYVNNEKDTALIETNIQSAIDNLVDAPKVDTTNLVDILNRVEAIDRDKYVDLTKLDQAIANGKAVLVNPSSQQAIDDAVDAIVQAIFNLTLKPDTTKLVEAITRGQDIDRDKYTDLTALDAAIKKGQEIVANPTSEKEVSDAISAIDNAIENLQLKVEVNKDALAIAVLKANEITDLDNVVPVVVKEFNEALKQATAVLNDDKYSQEEVDQAFDRLSSAMQKLSFIKGDKTQLQSMYDKVMALDEQAYIPSTYTTLKAMLPEVKELLKDENALEKEVNEMHDSLTRAFLDLRLKPNKDLLKGLIEKANALNEKEYDVTSWEVLKEAVSKANKVYKDNEATNEMVSDVESMLTRAIEGLVKVETEKPDNKPTTNNPTITTPTTNNSSTSVKTGDEMPLVQLITIGSAALASIYLLKKKEND